MSSDKGKKGFAGLDSMVSEVDRTSPPVPVEKLRQSTPTEVSSKETRPVYTGQPRADSGSNSSGKWWVVGVGIVVLLVWIVGSNIPSQSRQASNGSSFPAPVVAPYSSPVPAHSVSSNEERIPPVGTGLIFDRYQVRYCLSEEIRVTAWQEQVNRYSEVSLGAFNAAVDDYNARCSNFRYRSGTLESVRSEVEANRALLIRQGLAKAARNV